MDKEKEDQTYWETVGEVLGIQLYGWTFRNRAAFFYEGSGSKQTYFELPFEIAEKILRLHDDG